MVQDCLTYKKLANKYAKKVKKPKALSVGEETFAVHLMTAHIPYEREYLAIPDRRFKYDFRIKGTKILIEIQGGLGMRKGGHNSWSGIHRDMEKANLAAEYGYTLYAYSTQQVKSGMAIKHLMEVL